MSYRKSIMETLLKNISSSSLKFSNDFLFFDFNSDGYNDIFIPYTELPYSPTNLESNKNFLAFEKSYIVN